MAIRDIVTRGFGNGTYDPTVNDVPTRGYTIGEVVATVDGPGCWHTGQVYRPGYMQGDAFRPGFKSGERVC